MDTPPILHMKLNFDGASNMNKGFTSVQGIFQNHNSQVICTFYKWIGYNYNNYHELESLIRGFQLAMDQGFTYLIIKGD